MSLLYYALFQTEDAANKQAGTDVCFFHHNLEPEHTKQQWAPASL